MCSILASWIGLKDLDVHGVWTDETRFVRRYASSHNKVASLSLVDQICVKVSFVLVLSIPLIYVIWMRINLLNITTDFCSLGCYWCYLSWLI